MRPTDLHQHLWPEPLVAVLSRRRRPPRLRRSVLELPGGARREVDLDAHGLETRLALLDRLGIEVAVVSLAPTLGFEELPAQEARELVDAYEEGALGLADASSGRIVPLSAGGRLEGLPGACVGARRLRDLEALAPLLGALERRGALLFVHPGPSPPARERPVWWPAIVDATAQLQEAYAAWLAVGVRRWPALRVLFASLAGGGPFQLERLRAFGVGGRETLHENLFFETSSYGKRALELCLSTFGVRHLVLGTDVPTLRAEKALQTIRIFGDAVQEALWIENPARLLR